MSTLTEQQHRAVSSIDSNVLVSAGAGSGKTHVLVERYLETLRQKPELTVANMVAVTYTKKAASEMRTRLKSRLEELVAQAVNDEEARRWLTCREEIDAARIGTIHSLCDSILKTFPSDAGVDPQFELLDELESAEMLSDSIDETFMQLLQNNQEQDLFKNHPVEDIKKWLIRILRSIPQFEEAEKRMSGFSDEQLADHCQKLLIQLQKQIITEVTMHDDWADVFEYLQQNTVLNAPGKLGDLCRDTAGNMKTVNQYCDRDSNKSEVLIAWRSLKDIAEIQLRAGGNSPEAKEIKQSLKKLRELIAGYIKEMPDGLNDQDKIAFVRIRSLVHLKEYARKIYEQRKKQEQKLDFNDLIMNTYDLLSKPASTAKAFFTNNLAAILVDEFQDTNKMQSRLLAMLAGPQTRLFLIGDDKQSIYKFQGADVSTFNEWRRYLQKANDKNENGADGLSIEGPCSVETLNKSFRSHKQIVMFVNHISSKVLTGGDSNPSYRAVHQPLEFIREDGADNARVECMVFDARDEHGERLADTVLNLETKAVAAWINEKIMQELPVYDKEQKNTRNIGYGDIAVLVQRNSDISLLEDALIEANIPYVTMGGASFLQKQEVYDLENLLKFLNSPQDNHALFGVLRSPIFAFSDDLIHCLMANKKDPLWKLVKDASNQADNPTITQAALLIGKFLQLSSYASLPDLVRRIVIDTNYDTILMSLPNGKQRSRNLWKFVAMTNEHRNLSIAEFLHRLSIMRKLELKWSAAPVDSGNSVKLMTIHSSKGLEFPVVALPLMGVSALSQSNKLLFHPEYGIAFDTTRSSDEEKPAYCRLARVLENDMAIAEKKRLLYVAMTRARDYLGVFIENGTRNNQSFSAWLKAIILGNEGANDEAVSGQESGLLNSAESVHRIRSIDSESLPDWLSQINQSHPVNTPLDNKERLSGMCDQTDLLVQIPQSNILPAVAWQKLKRITPKDNEEQLESTVIGNYFHLLMEKIAYNLKKPDDLNLQQAAKAVGVYHPVSRQKLIAASLVLLDKLWDSEFYTLLSRCQLRLSEPSYLMRTGQGDFTSKRPDLLLQDGDNNFYVIDYKTDHFDVHEIKNQAAHHLSQLNAYVSDIRGLTGITPRAAVYFAREGILYFVNAAIADS